MNKLLELITLDDLGENERAMAEIIGIELFLKLVTEYGGTAIYLPKAESLILPARNNIIAREFNGMNYYELSRKWNLTERYIREIVREKAEEMRHAPIEGQTSLFENVV